MKLIFGFRSPINLRHNALGNSSFVLDVFLAYDATIFDCIVCESVFLSISRLVFIDSGSLYWTSTFLITLKSFSLLSVYIRGV